MKTDYTLESLRPLSMSAIATPNPAAVDQSVTFTPAPPPVDTTDLYGYWPLDEASGNPRASTLGTAPDLAESGGAITEVAGRFSNAASSTKAETQKLSATLNPPLAVSAGLTIAFWFKWPTLPTSSTLETMLVLENAATAGIAPWIHVGRYWEYLYTGGGFAWGAGADYIIVPQPRIGELAIDEWHLFVFTYDATTGVMVNRADDGCLASAPVWTALPLPALKLAATVPPARRAAANAITFDTLKILGKFNNNFVNFEGALDDLRIWTRALTATEIEDLWTEAAPCGDIPPYTYLWDFGDALPTVNQTGLYGYWPLDEASGNARLCTLGSGPDLAEVGGAVSHTAGRFGNAITSTITATSALRATLSPTIAMADGLTIAVWFKWGAFVTPAAATTLFCLNVNGQGFPGLQAGRFYDSNYMFAEFAWAAWPTGKVVSLGPTQLGPYDQGVWHLFVLTYDPATGNFTGRMDDGCFASDLVWDYGRDGLPADYLQMTVPPADLATANAAVFNWLRVSEALNGNYADWGGEIDDLRIWTRVLTVAEIADLWYRSDEETPTYSYGEAGAQTVTATVTSAHGCVASRSIEVVVS